MSTRATRHTRSTAVRVVFSTDNPRVLQGGATDIEALWRCAVTHRDTGKKLTPIRVAAVDFPPSDARRLLSYSTPAAHDVCDTGIAGWRFRFRADPDRQGDEPRPHTVRLKVWVASLGWNYSEDAWSFEEQITSGAGSAI